MKNILFIGPYRQADGWGDAAKHYIQALALTGHNLSIRPVYMADSVGEIPLEFLEYEENRFASYDMVIQNVLPHYLEYNPNFGKNVALIYTETKGWQNSWVDRLNKMDEIWVPSKRDAMNVVESGVNKLVERIPIPTDVSKFNQSYDSKELTLLQDTAKESFIFYFIGEFIQRKGLEKLVQAFHTEFSPKEPVELIIKTSKPGHNPEQVAKILNDYCNKIKAIMRIYGNMEKYKKEMFITSRLSYNDLMALHYHSDCFVMPSCGESWSIPVSDALGFGKTPMVVQDTGPNDMVTPNNGWIIPSFEENVFVLDPPLADIYTSKEMWYNISVHDLCSAMRVAYEGRNLTDKSSQGMEDIHKYSYGNIAKKINEYTS